MARCPWCEKDPLYKEYHDREWGVPIINDQKHYEFLVLESAQAGLNWLTILKKRDHYRQAFQDFDPARVATYGPREIQLLLEKSGIIKNRRKIEASINNARRFLEIQNEFGSFCNYIWGFVDHEPVVNNWHSLEEIPPHSSLSETISSDMKQRGFQFIGPTIIYSHLQATGLINDHLLNCFRYQEIIDGYPTIFSNFCP